MIELPETYVLSEQINKTLVGKTIKSAAANTHPHAFAGYTGDPAEYNGKLAGKKIMRSTPGMGNICGGNTVMMCGDAGGGGTDMLLVMSTPVKYHAPGEKLPKSHQLLLEFDDGSHMSCTVQMWGAMCCYPVGEDGLPKEFNRNNYPDPLTDAFDETYFDGLWRGVKPTLSAKAFLATEQRIPGLGNGVLQDILFNAGVHPKRKLQTISGEEKNKLFRSVKSTLKEMRDGGGRDTERDLFGKAGGYRTILSSKTLTYPCRVCGDGLIREAYLGGNIYFCPTCQPME
jgi:formamidopyrimidine-DNA glycosylase